MEITMQEALTRIIQELDLQNSDDLRISAIPTHAEISPVSVYVVRSKIGIATLDAAFMTLPKVEIPRRYREPESV